MQTAANLASSYAMSPSERATKPCSAEQPVKRLNSNGTMALGILANLYPQTMRVAYPDEESFKIACKIWNRALADIDFKYIEMALDRCVDEFEYPPEIAKFKALCLSLSGHTRYKTFHRAGHESSSSSTNDIIHLKPLIRLGAEIVKELKKDYPEKTSYELSQVLSVLRRDTQKQHPNKNDIQVLEILKSQICGENGSKTDGNGTKTEEK